MKRRILISAFSLPFLCATYVGTQQAAAAACGSGELLYEDKMQSSADEAWGWGEDATRSIGAEGVSWTLDPNVSWTTFNETSLYTDFELCVDLSMQYPEKSNGWVGVTFWGVDKQNNYTVSIYPIDGGISIYRVQNGKYLKPVPYFKSDAVKTGLGVTNELSVVVTGKHVVVS